MFHSKRTYRVIECNDVDELAKMLGESQCLCTGYKCQGVLFLNDSTSEDGAQEYAIVLPRKDGLGLQVESVTYSWIEGQEKRVEDILDMIHYKDVPDESVMQEPVVLRIDTAPKHSCRYCE